VLLSPGALVPVLDALERALDDGTLEPERVRQSVRRRLKWAQWASPPNDWRRPSGADTAWGALLADRVLKVLHGPLPALGTVTEVAVVNDDIDVPGAGSVPLNATTVLVEALRVGGHDARLATAPTVASGGPLVIALFSDYLPFKQRTTVLPASIAAVHSLIAQAAALSRGAVLVGLGDPRLAAQLALEIPTIVAWSGDRVMQQAAARTLLRTRRG
jgi:beta-glucosidase